MIEQERPRLWWLAPLLLLAVAVTHYGYDPLSVYFTNSGYAARNLFYAFRGAEGVVFAVVIGILARRADVAIVCLWAVSEEGMTSACRVAKGIGEPNRTHETFVGLCGNGAYSLGLFIGGLVALGFLYELGRARGKT